MEWGCMDPVPQCGEQVMVVESSGGVMALAQRASKGGM